MSHSREDKNKIKWVDMGWTWGGRWQSKRPHFSLAVSLFLSVDHAGPSHERLMRGSGEDIMSMFHECLTSPHECLTAFVVRVS